MARVPTSPDADGRNAGLGTARPAPDTRSFLFDWKTPLLFAAVLLCYLPALRGGFVWDDDAHVTRPELRSLAGLREIWFRLGATQQYYPVVHSAFWLEHRIWGDAVLGYHLLNVGLHALAACLFAAVLALAFAPDRSAGGSQPAPGADAGNFPAWPWLAAFLFALHPVCVESVAWISEQKNTLSTVFYLLAAWVYLDWHRRIRLDPRFERGAGNGRLSQYLLASLFFLLALLSKSVTATLPAALLLVLAWRNGGRLGWRRDVAPLLPWFLAGAASGLLTAWVERRYVGAEGSDYALSLADRFVLAGRVVGFYLDKLLWPARLAFVYPRWTVDAGAAAQWIPAAVVVVALLAAIATLAGRGRHSACAAALLFFVGTLFPALGFVNVYPFRYSFVADHFQYLASLGVFALAGAGLSALAGRLGRPAAAILLAALFAVLSALSFAQARLYRDGDTLYRSTLARNPGCWLAYSNLGTSLLEAGRIDEAVADLAQALRLHPDAEAEYNLANALRAGGRAADAVPHYRAAIRLRPDDPRAHDNLGTTLAGLGRWPEAIREYRAALVLLPQYPEALNNLGYALAMTGSLEDAIAACREAVRLRPDEPLYQNNLGLALAQGHRPQDAIAAFERALALRPGYREARLNLSFALRDAGRAEEGYEEYRRALAAPKE